MRVVIELQARTPIRASSSTSCSTTRTCRQTFGVNMLALVNNRPRTVNLLELVDAYIEHRKDVVVRRTRFDLDKAEKRAHILEGYRIALDHIDELVALIRRSHDAAEASRRMQATLRPQRSAGARRFWKCACSASPASSATRSRPSTARPSSSSRSCAPSSPARRWCSTSSRTKCAALREQVRRRAPHPIVDATGEFDVEDLIADEPMVITFSHNGYIKRLPPTTYRRQHRGGRGVAGFGGQEDDFVEQIFVASHAHLSAVLLRPRPLLLGEGARAAAGRTHGARQGDRQRAAPVARSERITSTVPVRDFSEEGYLVMATRQGRHQTLRSLGLQQSAHAAASSPRTCARATRWWAWR